MTRPDQVIVDRFDLANASFWLDQMAGWLAQPGHGDRLAADLWPGVVEVGPPLRVIVGRAAAALRSALNSPEVR